MVQKVLDCFLFSCRVKSLRPHRKLRRQAREPASKTKATPKWARSVKPRY